MSYENKIVMVSHYEYGKTPPNVHLKMVKFYVYFTIIKIEKKIQQINLKFLLLVDLSAFKSSKLTQRFICTEVDIHLF